MEPVTTTRPELDRMASVIDELINYSLIHFATEESAMLEAGYPDYQSHILAHGHFKARVSAFKRAFRSGQPVRTDEIILFIRNWWRDHILGADLKYAPFLGPRNSGF